MQRSIEIERARRRHPSGQEKAVITPNLTVTDRCDGCTAAAVYRVCAGLNVLDYCGHHWRKYQPVMPGWQVIAVNKDLLETVS